MLYMAGSRGVHHERLHRVMPPDCRPRRTILRLSAALLSEEARQPQQADIDWSTTMYDNLF